MENATLQQEIIPLRSLRDHSETLEIIHLETAIRFSDNFGAPLRTLDTQKSRKPQEWIGYLEDFSKIPRCCTTNLFKLKNPIVRCHLRQMVDVKFMGGESASTTNPEKVCSGKCKINNSGHPRNVSTGEDKCVNECPPIDL